MKKLILSRQMLVIGLLAGIIIFLSTAGPTMRNAESVIGGYIPSDGACCTGTTAGAACSQCKACPTCPYYGCSGTFTKCDMASFWTTDRCDGVSGTAGTCWGANPACGGIEDSICN